MAWQAPRRNQDGVETELKFGMLGMRHQPGLRGVDDAAYAVTPRQQGRIIDAAQGWLMAHPEHAEFELRFDAVLIAPRRLPRHLLAAFDASA